MIDTNESPSSQTTRHQTTMISDEDRQRCLNDPACPAPLPDPTRPMDDEADFVWSRAKFSDSVVGGGKVHVIRQYVPDRQEAESEEPRVAAHLRIGYESDSTGAKLAVVMYIEEDDDTVDVMYQDGTGEDAVCASMIVPLALEPPDGLDAPAAVSHHRQRAAMAFATGRLFEATAEFGEALRHCGYQEGVELLIELLSVMYARPVVQLNALLASCSQRVAPQLFVSTHRSTHPLRVSRDRVSVQLSKLTHMLISRSQHRADAPMWLHLDLFGFD